MKTAIYFVLLLTWFPLGVIHAQVVMRPGTQLGFNDKPDVTIQATGNITTNDVTDFAATNLQLILAADLAITGNLIATQLTLAGGNAALNNNLTVSQSISFAGGLLTPSATAKLSFTGNGHDITGGGNQSYINGVFYQSGGGYRFYPVGVNGTYAPAVFDNISTTDETGVEVIAADAALTISDPTEITSVDPAHYWLLTTADPAAINSRVSLGLNGITTPGEGSLAVMQADAPGTIATSLGVFSTDDTQVTSRVVVSKPLIAIGTIPTVVVKVRDLITPFDGADNNSLYIEKIDAFDFNTVTLMDRWGVVVKRWENFTNEVDYDFTQLSPGNYIVLVEFGNNAEGSTKEKISQMVTVLKTN
jgi:hypothetical protein